MQDPLDTTSPKSASVTFTPPDISAFNAILSAPFRMTGRPMSWYADQVKRMTYKPGFTISIRPSSYSFTGDAHYLLVLLMHVEDTYNPGKYVDVGGTRYIPTLIYDKMPDDHAAAQFAQFVARELQELEIHESREWFKVDGKIFDNPHENR